MKRQTVTQAQIETVKNLVLKAIERSNEDTKYPKVAQIEIHNNDNFVTLDVKITLQNETNSLLDLVSQRSLLIQVKPRSFNVYYESQFSTAKPTKSRLETVTSLLRHGII
jgi:hypothetical protein